MLRTQRVRPVHVSAAYALYGVLFLALPACQGETPKRSALPTESATAAEISAPKPSASVREEVPANLKRKFGLSDLRFSPCVHAVDGGPLIAENCGSGAILFGPYARVPKDATVVVNFTVEGVAGSTELLGDVVSGGGSRLHVWVGRRTLQAGAKEVIEFGTLIGNSAKDFETRLWSQTQDKTTVFKILDARVEIRGP